MVQFGFNNAGGLPIVVDGEMIGAIGVVGVQSKNSNVLKTRDEAVRTG